MERRRFIGARVLAAVLTIVALSVTQTAWGLVTTQAEISGFKRSSGNQSFYAFKILTMWGGESSSLTEGSSYTFNNFHKSYLTINNGTINFQEATSATDVITGSTLTMVFSGTNDKPAYFYGATVKNGNNGTVSGCSVSISSDKKELTVSIPSGKTFRYIDISYVPNPPISSSNTTVGLDASTYIYKGSAVEPEPTVTYGNTVLTLGTDYTLSYSNSNAVGTATVTVTGTGNYAGTVTKDYTIRNIALSDFNSLGNNTYEIATREDLANLSILVNIAGNLCSGLTFRQSADITCNSDNTPIGDVSKAFNGTYDGQNHTISEFTVNQGNNYVGLFRLISGGTVKNLVLTNSTITGDDYTGGIVGYNVSGTVENVVLTNSTITGDEKTGGIVGYNIGGTIKNAILTSSTITGGDRTGGIVGYNIGGMVENCRVKSDVTVNARSDTKNYYGGIAGMNYDSGTIAGCMSAAKVSPNGKSNVNSCGGIVGLITSSNVRDCLYTGTSVTISSTSSSNVGAIAGNTSSSTFTNNYYTTSDLAGTYSGDRNGARRAQTVTIGENVVLVGDETAYDVSGLTAIGSGNYALRSGTTIYSGATQTLTLSYTGEVPTNYTLTYLANGTPIEGNTYEMTDADVSITASVAPITYSITYDLAGGSVATNNPATYTVETPTFTLNNPTRTGYMFAGWTQAEGDTPQSTVTIETGSTGNRTYTAHWTTKTYTVTLDNQGATTAGTESVSATFDAAMPAITVPTRTGYIFGGYYTETNGGGTKYYNADGTSANDWDIDSATTLYAQWTSYWSIVNDALQVDGANVVLDRDITAGDGDIYLLVPSGVTATLDLNGHTINRNLTSYGGTDGSAIRVKGTLTINDSQGGGTITGGYGYQGGGVYVDRNATFTMNSGTITGNTASDYGGGVMVKDDATCTLNGVTITGNTAYSGGGVYVDSSGSSCTLNGVTITGNTTSKYGGGVYVAGYTTLSGLCTITGNTAGGQPDNVHFDTDKPMTFGGNLDTATRIGVNVDNYYQTLVITSGLAGRGSLDNFFCDKEGDQLSLNSDGEAVLTNAPIEVSILLDTQNAYGISDLRLTDAEGTELGDTWWYYSVLSGTPVYVRFTLDNEYVLKSVEFGEDDYNKQPATLVSVNTGDYGREFVYTFTVPYITSSLYVYLTTKNRYSDRCHIDDYEDNTSTIASYYGIQDIGVGFDRTLYKDGGWNTLCLPFDVEDGDDTDDISFSGTPLEGATVKTLSSSSFAGGTLTLNFTDVSRIEAGKPYIVKWESGEDIYQPQFEGVTITNCIPTDIETDIVDFVGTYDQIYFGWYEENRSVLLMGADSKLFYPDGKGKTWLNACRGYFRLHEGYVAGDPADPASGIKFVMNFDEDATGVENTEGVKETDDVWYDLSGRKIEGRPTVPGVYIHEGRKVLVK